MKKICKTCNYWKLYLKLNNNCACMGLSSGTNPGSQLYTSENDYCKLWIKRPSFKKFRDSIKPKIK